jgi:hypothetical protein
MTTIACRRAINAAKSHLDTDPTLSAFILRDLPEIRQADLDDLAWALHRDGNVHKNDVLGLIELLESHLERTEATR